MAHSVLVLHRPWLALVALTVASTGLVFATPATAAVKAPVVKTVSPAAGKTAGHNVVTITGSSFHHVSKVLFGTKAGTKVHVVSSTKLTVVAPKHSAGTVDVRVVVKSGSTSKASAKRSADRYHYYAQPAVTAVSPSKGALAGGDKVTVTGSGFRKVTKVAFGATAGTHVTVTSATRLTVVAPKHKAGTVDVIVSGKYGQSSATSKDRYRYSTLSPAWHATEAPLPTSHLAAPMAVTNGLACSTASSCVAVGNYTDKSSHPQGVIDTMSRSSWTAARSPLPAGAGANPAVNLAAAACETSTTCVAVGYYLDHNEHSQGLLDARAGSKWTATEAPLPHDANSIPQAQLTAAACAPTSDCFATGTYSDTDGETQGLLEKLSGGTWTATEAPLPSVKGTDVETTFDAISCPSASSCVAVGWYLGSGDEQQAIIEVLSGGSWHAVAAPLPGNANSPFQAANLSSVSCATAGSCVAVGQYVDNNGDQKEGLIESISGESATPLEAPLPSNVDTIPNAGLASVSCLSGLPCVAVGSYLDKTTTSDGLIETIASPGSAIPTEAPLPTSGVGHTTAGLAAVACGSSTCTATGLFADSKGVEHGVIDTLAHSSWTAIQAPVPSNNYHGTPASPEPTDLTQSVYAGGGTFLAIGEYPDRRIDTEGLIDTYSG